jgi:hypothetical protein
MDDLVLVFKVWGFGEATAAIVMVLSCLDFSGSCYVMFAFGTVNGMRWEAETLVYWRRY